MLIYDQAKIIPPKIQCRKDKSVCEVPSSPLMAVEQEELIQPKKLAHPILESPTHRGLLRELLLTQKWGLLPGERPELQKVLEQRRLEQLREQEVSASDLQVELRKQKERLLAYELEEMRYRDSQQNIPEFMRVRGNLRPIQVSGH